MRRKNNNDEWWRNRRANEDFRFGINLWTSRILHRRILCMILWIFNGPVKIIGQLSPRIIAPKYRHISTHNNDNPLHRTRNMSFYISHMYIYILWKSCMCVFSVLQFVVLSYSELSKEIIIEKKWCDCRCSFIRDMPKVVRRAAWLQNNKNKYAPFSPQTYKPFWQCRKKFYWFFAYFSIQFCFVLDVPGSVLRHSFNSHSLSSSPSVLFIYCFFVEHQNIIIIYTHNIDTNTYIFCLLIFLFFLLLLLPLLNAFYAVLSF